MKREDVRLGMVVYDKFNGCYARVVRLGQNSFKDMVWVRFMSASRCNAVPYTDLRPLTKRERGER